MLPIVGDPTNALTLALGVVLLPLLCGAAGHWPKFWLGVMAVMAVPDAFRLSISALSFGPVQVYPADAIFAVAAVVVIFRLLDRRASLPMPLAAIAVLAVVQLGIGVRQFGATTAVNEFRSFFYLLAGAGFALACIPREEAGSVLRRVLVAVGLVYACAALVGWWRFGLQGSSSTVLINGRDETARGVTASYALLIAQAGLVMLVTSAKSRPQLQRLTGAALLVMVILLQHRTVWLVVAFALVVLWLRSLIKGRSWAVIAIPLTLWTALVLWLGTAAVGGGKVAEELSDSYHSALGTGTTSSWRVDGWTDLLQVPANSLEWLFGRPFGTGFSRVILNQVINVQPHNFYIQVLLRLGIVGLALMVLLYLRAIHRAIGQSNVAVFVLLSQLLFMVGYGLPLDQGVLLGLALLAVWSRPDPVPVEPVDAAERTPALI